MKQPFLGVGIGLRRAHYEDLLQSKDEVDWLEIISENFMDFGGYQRDILEQVSQRWPIISHGVGLSLGTMDPFPEDYLTKLRTLLERINAPWFSDHLCFSSFGGNHYHDLIPLLRTEESVKHVVKRIREIQDYFKRPFAIENISHYTESKHHTMSEIEYLNRVLRESDALLLLDINNVYVNATNHGFDPYDFLDKIDSNRVIQIHLAGHFDRGDILIDTHGAKVTAEVWKMYEYFVEKAGRPITTLIEWDNDLPSFQTLLEEVKAAKSILHKSIIQREFA